MIDTKDTIKEGQWVWQYGKPTIIVSTIKDKGDAVRGPYFMYFSEREQYHSHKTFCFGADENNNNPYPVSESDLETIAFEDAIVTINSEIDKLRLSNSHQEAANIVDFSSSDFNVLKIAHIRGKHIELLDQMALVSISDSLKNKIKQYKKLPPLQMP